MVESDELHTYLQQCCTVDTREQLVSHSCQHVVDLSVIADTVREPISQFWFLCLWQVSHVYLRMYFVRLHPDMFGMNCLLWFITLFVISNIISYSDLSHYVSLHLLATVIGHIMYLYSYHLHTVMGHIICN